MSAHQMVVGTVVSVVVIGLAGLDARRGVPWDCGTTYWAESFGPCTIVKVLPEAASVEEVLTFQPGRDEHICMRRKVSEYEGIETRY